MSWVATKASSQVHSLKYDPVEQTLDVRFACNACKSKGCDKCGHMGHSSHYRYDEVPVAVYDSIRNAESVGAELNRLLKRGEHSNPPRPFAYQRVA